MEYHVLPGWELFSTERIADEWKVWEDLYRTQFKPENYDCEPCGLSKVMNGGARSVTQVGQGPDRVTPCLFRHPASTSGVPPLAAGIAAAARTVS
jgi:hypothetical protein